MRRGLQVVVGILGVVGVTVGLLSVVLGVASVPGDEAVNATVDSEFRFFAAWYVFAGVIAIRAARRIERETFTIRLLGAVLLLAAAGRIISIAVVGRPHWSSLVLLALEILVPAVVVPWQGAVARRGS